MTTYEAFHSEKQNILKQSLLLWIIQHFNVFKEKNMVASS